MAVVYSEDIAAAGAVAGVPYGETECAVAGVLTCSGLRFRPVSELVAAVRGEQDEAEEQRLVPMMVVHSTNDDRVPFQNATDLRDAWIDYYGAAATPVLEADCTIERVACTARTYARPDGAVVVGTVLYDGATTGQRHYWVGDNRGTYANPDGPSATEHLWAFFKDKRLVPPARIEVSFAPAQVAGTDATITVDVTAEAPIDSVHVRLAGRAPQPERRAEGTGPWTVRFEGLPDDELYTPVARVVLRDGRSRTASGPEFAVGEPVKVVTVSGNFNEHVIAGRLAFQQPPCIFGFGACDADSTTILGRFGLAPFNLHNPQDTARWYVDPANVPR